MQRKLFLIIFLVGVFLRFYRLPQTMQFLGDQGRDALTVRRMLIERHPALIGPVTSVGNMYLGPFYYYFMLLPLMLTYPDPTGPAYAVAFLGVITLWLIYRLGKEIVGERAALFASFAFAISPLVLTFSRFSWNPNIVPLFALLFIWHLFQALKGKDKAWIWVSLWFAILIQLHYITLILGAFAGLAWIHILIGKLREKKLRSTFLVSTLIAIAIFLVSLTPLIAFDLRHNNINSKAFMSFFSGSQSHFSLVSSLTGRLVTNVDILSRAFTGLFSFQLSPPTKYGAVLFLVGLLIFLVLQKRKYILGERLIFLGLLSSVLGLSFYGSTLHDHYLVFLFPFGVLLLGVLLASIWDQKFLRPMVILVLAAMAMQSWIHYPGKMQLGYNIFMMKRATQEIEKHLVPQEKYNLFLFTPTNDYQGMNYRYFLTTGKQSPESENEFLNFSTLYVIQDIPEDKINLEDHYIFAIWPNRTVIEQFDVKNGPRVFVLKR